MTTLVSRRSQKIGLSAGIFVFLLALFPIVPMPIAGGVPIQIALISTIFASVLLFQKALLIDRASAMFLTVAVLLFSWEALSAVYHATQKDAVYVLARGLWILVSFAVILALSPWVKAGRVDIAAAILSLALIFLIGAMCIEAVFFPRWAVGRQLGVINIPFPRATGVPNSDGKLGTFLVICLSFFLFVRPKVPKWQLLVLQFGPWIGLAFTQSRSTLLAMGITYGLYWVITLFSTRSVFIALLRLSGILTGLFIVGLIGVQITRALVGEGIYQRNVDVRFDHVGYAFGEIAQAPILGSGADAIREESDKAGIHNTPLAMSVKSGVPSGFLIAFIILLPAWTLRKKKQTAAYALTSSMGVLTEHLLYPGFINEFLIFSFLIPLMAQNAYEKTRTVIAK